MNQKILHITKKPPVICHDPHPHSVIPIHEDYMNWIYENYIQLSSFKNITDRVNLTWIEYIFLNDYYHNNPFVEVEILSEGIVTESIVEWIIDHINQHQYIGICVDRFYIHEHVNYKLDHLPHGLLIYGYDLDRQVFYAADFFKRIYSCKEIPINQLVEGYTAATNEPKVMMFSYKDNIKYGLNVQRVFQALEDYYTSNDHHMKVEYSLQQSIPKTFGLDTYRVLKQLYEVTAIEMIRLDIRPLHTLYEHKKRMTSLLEHLSRSGMVEIDPNWIQGYKELLRTSESIRNLFIKCELTRDQQYLARIIQWLEWISERERGILDPMLNRYTSIS
ncbi:hypothetical protein [Paenibacillus solani]|uniref:Butirosin biosynthesis protein H N-terminal domain-containing protein n=1 Tax=Paenibacillus solani TaxID=1705565 RepID=A0A0M1N3L7_9BACL|nr:hypothetical protein [Paenibacillus solani]KOR76748.1 hypothetical protein AM231_22650 [Paenibacillus solani]